MDPPGDTAGSASVGLAPSTGNAAWRSGVAVDTTTFWAPAWRPGGGASVGAAAARVYKPVVTLLGSQPVIQAAAFKVRLWSTVTVSPDVTTGSESVGSEPLVV
jgi:hypothetical protein